MRNSYKAVFGELAQSPETRQKLFAPIEAEFGGRAVVTLFTSFQYNVALDDTDADMLQSVLQQNDLSKGLVLMLNTPGGDGLAAERIVNICKAYSGTGDFWVLVPGKAKSAGTIVALGASKILMSASSELGPVDPQIFRNENGRTKVFSAHSLVSGFDNLFAEATRATGPMEPYLLQLSNYDVREINSYRSLIQLAEDIAVKMLAAGAMVGVDIAEIQKRITIFLDPNAGTLSHGRPIFAPEAQGAGLPIETIDVKSDLWENIYELYARSERFVSFRASKSVESKEDAFYVASPD